LCILFEGFGWRIFVETGAVQRSILNVLRLGKCKRESIGVGVETSINLYSPPQGLQQLFGWKLIGFESPAA
jgi:hypothetical protein